ncbi:hypothetical protein WMO13_04060 [Ignatzschineria larvae DSM 13226]|uniref:Immunity protein 49 n=1 Tax=Ignatzschineria larvae DSM 13226 TaxID=1111732 RepID=A0ABZ3C2H6_9GAMM|nr:hypothetical protein [Ignatzschineria larvae]
MKKNIKLDKLDKLDKSLLQVKKWAEDSISLGNDYCEDGYGLRDYIDTGEKSTAALAALGHVIFVGVGESLLLAKEGNPSEAIIFMQINSKRYVNYLILDLILARKYQRSAAIDLDEVNNVVFLALASGLPNLAQKFYRFMMKELGTGDIITNGHTNFMTESLRYSAMAMTIFNDWLNLPPPDLKKLALPKDPVWMKYANHWREENVELFAEILNEACDVHIERIGLTQKEYDSGEYEFASPFEAVYPAEILGVLRLRERLGLQNPELTHPLLLTPYAQITSPAIDHMSIEDPLLDDYLGALRKYNPELIEAWDKFQI